MAEINPFRQARQRVWIERGLLVGALAVAAALVWYAANRHAVTLHKEEPVSTLMAVMPPPPPPPPPAPKEVVKETVPQPQPVEKPSQPVVKDNAVTENAEPQQGTDDFQIGAGSGDGLRGGGLPGAFNRGAYASYLAQVIREAVQANADLHRKSFRVAISLWLSPAGKITRAQLRKGTGSQSDDQALQNLLAALPPLDQVPPQSVLDALPVQMTIDLRKAL